MSGEINQKAAGMETTETQAGGRRSGVRIMGQLIGLVKPLLPVMLLAIALGIIGYLCAIFLTILAGYGMMHIVFFAANHSFGFGTDIDEWEDTVPK